MDIPKPTGFELSAYTPAELHDLLNQYEQAVVCATEAKEQAERERDAARGESNTLGNIIAQIRETCSRRDPRHQIMDQLGWAAVSDPAAVTEYVDAVLCELEKERGEKANLRGDEAHI